MNEERPTTDLGELHEEEEHEGLAPHRILDAIVFGRRLRALRILNGYDRATDFVAVLRSQYGVDMSERSLYAVERGEQSPSLELFFATVTMLKPEVAFFAPAFREDVMTTLRQTWGKA